MYLDIEHPVVAWNVYRGVLLSQSLIANCNPAGSFLSMTLARIVIDKDWERLEFEQILEDHRHQNFPDSTSRLRGLFVFDTPESALAVAEDQAWGGKGGHIRIENLTDVGVSAKSNKTRLDANWITWMLMLRHTGTPATKYGILESMHIGLVTHAPTTMLQYGSCWLMVRLRSGVPNLESEHTKW